jgi:DNA-binding LacI/PurR family transcriptional regulator
MATLKEVAETAGVSTATVSLALNNGPVNENTRQRVLEVARRLSYVPNAIGRSLTTGLSRNIQLLTLRSHKYIDTARETSLFHYIQEGFLSVATDNRYGVRFDVRSIEDADLQHYLEGIAGSGAIDGLAIITQFATDGAHLHSILGRSFPYVLLQPEVFGSDLNWIDMGNFAGGALVGELFADCGATQIALINGPETHVDAIERERGFRHALEAAGLQAAWVRYSDYTILGGYAAMEGLMRDALPDAVFCANDYMAAGALRRLHEGGVGVPDEVTVVGYDNSDICLGLYPTLTSVNNRFLELGQALASGLLDLLSGARTDVRQSFTPTLIKRGSHRRLRRSPRNNNQLRREE